MLKERRKMKKLFITIAILSICQIVRAVDVNNLDPNLYLQKIRELEQIVKAQQQKIDWLTVVLTDVKKENERLNALCKKAGLNTSKTSENNSKNETLPLQQLTIPENKTQVAEINSLPDPCYTLSANQLCSEYNANIVAADIKYKGRIIVVSGIIRDIGKDMWGEAYIVIGDDGFPSVFHNVYCGLTKGEESSIARLSKDQHVKVKGEVSFGTSPASNVYLIKCTLQ
jgi:hypothetical protein